MANSGDRKKSRDAKKKKSGSYNKTPKMPKDPPKPQRGRPETGQFINEAASFPGTNNFAAPKVGKRYAKSGSEKKRTMSDNRAADTKNITKIGKY